MSSSHLLWIGFNLFILLLLALDLGVFHRKSEAMPAKQALIWSGAWITLSLVFNVGIYLWRGHEVAIQFLTGYLIEKSLSVDNIFVFLTIFATFKIPPKHQYRVLYWGILGALVMRGVFIWAGVELLKQFHGIIYVFGAFLVFTGIKMVIPKKENLEEEGSRWIRFFRKRLSLTADDDTGRFFIFRNGKYRPTRLFLVLLVIETTDLIFALDSIPAVLAITPDPFIVYSSNVFAILGLRSLYFALHGAAQKIYYLHYGLAAILIFVGLKMALSNVIPIPTWAALGVIFVFLMISVLASVYKNRYSRR